MFARSIAAAALTAMALAAPVSAQDLRFSTPTPDQHIFTKAANRIAETLAGEGHPGQGVRVKHDGRTLRRCFRCSRAARSSSGSSASATSPRAIPVSMAGSCPTSSTRWPTLPAARRHRARA